MRKKPTESLKSDPGVEFSKDLKVSILNILKDLEENIILVLRQDLSKQNLFFKKEPNQNPSPEKYQKYSEEFTS